MTPPIVDGNVARVLLRIEGARRQPGRDKAVQTAVADAARFVTAAANPGVSSQR